MVPGLHKIPPTARQGSPAIPLTTQDDLVASCYSKPILNLPINSYTLHFPATSSPTTLNSSNQRTCLVFLYLNHTTGSSLCLECPPFLFFRLTNFESLCRTQINVTSSGKPFPAFPQRGGHSLFHITMNYLNYVLFSMLLP